MNRAAVLVACAHVACALFAPAQGRKSDPFEAVAPKGSALDALDALVPGLIDRLDVSDKASAPLLDARLGEIDRELKLWTTVHAYAKQGRIVELADLRPSRATDGLPIDAAAERALTAAAVRRLEAREREIAAARKAAPSDEAPAKAPTGHGLALLDVVVEAPPPATKKESTPSKYDARPVVDPAGLSKALYEAGDARGALDALALIPDAELSPEQLFRRARALDRLHRPDDAQAAFAEVVRADPEGFYGRQARWMLELSSKVKDARAPLPKPKSGSKEPKK
jgi:hypothetical protein